MGKRRTYGFSFSWRRASGLSALKGSVSRSIGIPLTSSGRERKLGRLLLGGGSNTSGGGLAIGTLLVVVVGLLFAFSIGLAVLVSLGIVAAAISYFGRAAKEAELVKAYAGALRSALSGTDTANSFPAALIGASEDWSDLHLTYCTVGTIRAALAIALSANDRYTAESKMQLAKDQWADLLGKHAPHLPEDVRSEIGTFVEAARLKFQTVLYMNAASASMAHAADLKTRKARSNHLASARQILEEGLQNPESDKQALTTLLAQVPEP